MDKNKKLISVDLLQRIGTALINMTGRSYFEINEILKEIGQLPNGIKARAEEPKDANTK